MNIIDSAIFARKGHHTVGVERTHLREDDESTDDTNTLGDIHEYLDTARTIHNIHSSNTFR